MRLDLFETKATVGEVPLLLIQFQQMKTGFKLRKYDLNVNGSLKSLSITDPNFTHGLLDYYLI